MDQTLILWECGRLVNKPERHPGGPRGRQATGVRQYTAYLMPEHAEAVKKLQHRLRIDTWSEMLRILIERAMKPRKWDGVAALLDGERERCGKVAEGEMLVDNTGTAEDEAYNAACRHIADKIRSDE